MSQRTILQSADLFFTAGSSDKVYHAQLCSVGDGYVVDFQYGRRGSTLTAGSKTPAPVGFDKAKGIFDKLVAEKTAKGYTPHESGAIFQGTENAGRVSGLLPQLPNAIDESDVPAYIRDPHYVAQEKKDGERRMVISENGNVLGVNRKGLIVALPVPIAEAVAAIGVNATLDGEQIGDTLFVFDLRMIGDLSIDHLGFADRFAKLQGMFDHLPPEHSAALQLVPAWVTSEEKAALLASVEAAGGEGVVFKLRSGRYDEVRPASGGDHLKFKFYDPAQVEVEGVSEGVRSVAVRVFDAEDSFRPVSVGNVTIPANAPMPVPGDILEVSYLYAYRGGSLYQPQYGRRRTDLDSRDCVLSQLKFKDEPPPSCLRRREFAVA